MNIPQDLRAEFTRLAEKYGDSVLLEGCAWVLLNFARMGAKAATTKRRGDPEIACERCRQRDASVKELETTLARVKTGAAIGGGAPSRDTTEE